VLVGLLTVPSFPSIVVEWTSAMSVPEILHPFPQQPNVYRNGESTSHFGARAGNRTLNIGTKRRLTFLARKRKDLSGRATRIRRSDAFVPQSVLPRHRLSRVGCQISCQTAEQTSVLSQKRCLSLAASRSAIDGQNSCINCLIRASSCSIVRLSEATTKTTF
jgi:hypothetical protein